jgi:hypothetical protein
MEDGKSLEHRQRTLRCKGNGMYRKCGLEPERPYPAQQSCKTNHLSQKAKLTPAGRGSEGFIVPKKLRTKFRPLYLSLPRLLPFLKHYCRKNLSKHCQRPFHCLMFPSSSDLLKYRWYQFYHYRHLPYHLFFG